MKIETHAVIEEFALESDPEGQATVIIRQATEGDNIARSSLFDKTERVIDDETLGAQVTLRTEFNQRKLRRKEAYLTLGSVTGIMVPGRKEGEYVELFDTGMTVDGPSVKHVMTERAFNAAWDRLPPLAAEEIGRLVRRVNPTWDPEQVGE